MNNVLDRRDFLKAMGMGAAAMALPGCMRSSDGAAGVHEQSESVRAGRFGR
jgi:hypothetical protein